MSSEFYWVPSCCKVMSVINCNTTLNWNIELIRLFTVLGFHCTVLYATSPNELYERRLRGHGGIIFRYWRIDLCKDALDILCQFHLHTNIFIILKCNSFNFIFHLGIINLNLMKINVLTFESKCHEYMINDIGFNCHLHFSWKSWNISPSMYLWKGPRYLKQNQALVSYLVIYSGATKYTDFVKSYKMKTYELYFSFL